MRRRVLVLRTGAAGPAVRARHGDWTAWFADALSPHADVAVADAEEPLPPARGLGGVVVTGSPKSVVEPEPWMDGVGTWLLEAARAAPVLGVCFGHQLLARALGARVERNPLGPEAGTAEIELTAAGLRDPLFAGVPGRLAVQQLHQDHVPAPPPGAVVLASNAHSPVQAFAHGRIRAVQFHPEFDAARSRALAEEERAWLDAARPGLADQVVASVRDTPEAAAVLANWAIAYVG
ncbi:MAG TPA: gamma-glutamyl-gamma-aminobutyrate hydrolase family protein [Anaeromyxobacteraceae bacterium]|nr:gamma-glutamyl-gamma-aminobutyrate hydrolase family protein [Anaeromyxobacteraceae bacterium]